MIQCKLDLKLTKGMISDKPFKSKKGKVVPAGSFMKFASPLRTLYILDLPEGYPTTSDFSITAKADGSFSMRSIDRPIKNTRFQAQQLGVSAANEARMRLHAIYSKRALCNSMVNDILSITNIDEDSRNMLLSSVGKDDSDEMPDTYGQVFAKYAKPDRVFKNRRELINFLKHFVANEQAAVQLTLLLLKTE